MFGALPPMQDEGRAINPARLSTHKRCQVGGSAAATSDAAYSRHLNRGPTLLPIVRGFHAPSTHRGGGAGAQFNWDCAGEGFGGW